MDAPQTAVSASQTMQTPQRHPPLLREYRMQAKAMEWYCSNGMPMVEDSMLATRKYQYG